MWVGTVEGVFVSFNQGNAPGFKKIGAEQFPIIAARKLYRTSEKSLYAGGMNNGVFEYTPQNGRWKYYRFPGNHWANQIYALEKDNHGRFLVGTMAGLFLLENETLKKFTMDGFGVDRPFFLSWRIERIDSGLARIMVRCSGMEKISETIPLLKVWWVRKPTGQPLWLTTRAGCG